MEVAALISLASLVLGIFILIAFFKWHPTSSQPLSMQGSYYLTRKNPQDIAETGTLETLAAAEIPRA